LTSVDLIRDYVIKQWIEYVKKPLSHSIYNASLESVTFSKRLKIAEVKSLHKKGDKSGIKIIDQYPLYLLSQEF
jgi:hypothetical protein